LAGLAFSQAPDYLRQYRLQLGRAIDEATAENATFEGDCKNSGLTRDQCVGRFLGESDLLAREKGFRMLRAPSRLNGLRRQADDFASSQAVVQMAGFVFHFDSEVASRAFDDTRIAIPPSAEGLLAGSIAFAFFLALLLLIPLPFRRRGEAIEKIPVRSGAARI
jgi:hypothetical protein